MVRLQLQPFNMGVFDFLKKIPTAQYFGALGNVAEGALNAVSGVATNKANKEIAQMNNAFNERMMDKQFEQNYRLMEEQNRYNSAESQVARLKAAGLNPSLALGQIASGSATSASANATGMPSASQVTMQAPQFQGFSDAIRYMLEKRESDAAVNKMNAETKGIQMSNEFAFWHNYLDLEGKYLQNRGTYADNYRKRIENNILPSMLSEQYQNMKLQNMDLQQSTQMKHFQSLMLEKQFNVFDTDFKMRMADMASQIELRMAQKQLTEKQATHEVLKWLETNERTNGLKISNDTNQRMADYIVEKAKLDSIPNGPFDINQISNIGIDQFIDKAKYHFNNAKNDVRNFFNYWSEHSHAGYHRNNH